MLESVEALDLPQYPLDDLMHALGGPKKVRVADKQKGGGVAHGYCLPLYSQPWLLSALRKERGLEPSFLSLTTPSAVSFLLYNPFPLRLPDESMVCAHPLIPIHQTNPLRLQRSLGGRIGW